MILLPTLKEANLSHLKLIKSYLQLYMSQGILNKFALISIECDYEQIIEDFPKKMQEG